MSIIHCGVSITHVGVNIAHVWREELAYLGVDLGMNTTKPTPTETNVIPAMTHPLSRYWDQPRDMRQVPMDDAHVLLSTQQMAALKEYSTSYPSGAYEGKCWKMKCGTDWLLCWYGPHANPDKLSIEYRIILEVENGN